MASRGMNAAGRATRELLVATAERLFAERGIDGVSLVQLGQVVDRRSPVVTQYYFGDKDGLIRAVYERSAGVVMARHQQLMDELHPAAGDTMAMATAMVVPYAEQLDGTSHYIGFLARLQADHTRPLLVTWAGEEVVGRWREMARRLRRLLPHLSRTQFERRLDLFTVITVAELARVQGDYYAGRMTTEQLEDTVADLVAGVAAVLAAPVVDAADVSFVATRGAGRGLGR